MSKSLEIGLVVDKRQATDAEEVFYSLPSNLRYEATPVVSNVTNNYRGRLLNRIKIRFLKRKF
jgi:hypothetical protein